MKLILLLLFPFTLLSQPAIEWQNTLGGDYLETAYALQITSDGGYIFASSAFSVNNGDVMGVHGGGDYWIVKLDAMGNLEWQKLLGGTTSEVPYSIKQTTDGGYIVAGHTFSNDGDVTGNHGSHDFWVVKLNPTGDIEWQRTLGGVYEEIARSIDQTTDGGYIVAGWAGSTDGDVNSPTHGLFELWVVKLSATGVIQWEKLYGGSKTEYAFSIRQTPEGGYIFAGTTSSNDGDVSGLNGNDDYWVVKLDSVGTIEWQKALGGIAADAARDVLPTSDGGYIVVGTAGSGNTGQVTGWHGLFDIWVVKLNQYGNLQWQKSLGGSLSDFGSAVAETDDQNFIIVGEAESINGDVQGNFDEGGSGWVVKLSKTGSILWQKPIGGTKRDRFTAVQISADGAIILAGSTESNDIDVSGNHGYNDAWIVKLAPENSSSTTPQTQPLEIYPNPASSSISINIPNDALELSINIVDLLGRIQHHQTSYKGGEIDIVDLPRGLYLLTATTVSGKVFSGKITRQ